MTPLILLALALVACSALLVVRAALFPRARAADRHAQIAAYGFAATDDNAAGAPRHGPFESVGVLLANRLGRERLAATRRKLLSAGLFDVSAETYLGYRALSALAFPLTIAYVAISAGQPLAIVVLATMSGAVWGWLLPQAIVARRGRLRLEQIDRAMPELVDLLVVGVESGMGLAGAMRASALRTRGALGDELKLMLREQSLGSSATDSLSHMLERCDTPAVRTFVRTIIQGERLGVSIGQMMRSLAEEMRKRRKAKAEELAQKAPVKILFPLVFLIFPAMFIVLLAPAAISITETMGGS